MPIARPFSLAQTVLAPAVFLALAPHAALAQAPTGTIIVRVVANGTPLSGVRVATRTTGGVTDQAGRATFKLKPGQYTFRTAPAGFRPESLSVFVGVGTTTRDLAVRPQAASTPNPALPPVTITPTTVDASAPAAVTARVAPSAAARAARTTTHVQVVDRAALDEQIEQSPGVITDALGRLDGVRVQTLSAGSAGAGIRIRGLPARYTKFFMNGLPAFGATPEGQDPLEISALGVDRIDVTPGVTSAFAGPTALGGIVNVVAGTPSSPSQAVVNGTTRNATDVAVFQTHTFSPTWAATLLAGRHERGMADPDDDGWAELGGYRRVAFRPSVWWNRSARSTWLMTGGWMADDRHSGTFGAPRLPVGVAFKDDARVERTDAGTIGRIVLDTNTIVTVRGSFTQEQRERWFRDERERARRRGIFGDVAATRTLGTQIITAGIALDRDQYTTFDTDNDYRYTTPAVYGEHTWTPRPWFGVTSSARVDLTQFGDFVSPRVSLLVRPTPMWTMRLSRANGVYLPTPLTDETETFGLRYVDIDMNDLQPEHAQSWALDVDGMKGPIELRASGYRTVVTHPLGIRIPPGSAVGLDIMNADADARYQGADASAHWQEGALGLTAAYAYMDATQPIITTIQGIDFQFDSSMARPAPYTPRHTARVETTLGHAASSWSACNCGSPAVRRWPTLRSRRVAPTRRSMRGSRSGSGGRSCSRGVRIS